MPAGSWLKEANWLNGVYCPELRVWEFDTENGCAGLSRDDYRMISLAISVANGRIPSTVLDAAWVYKDALKDIIE
jgi:hypothetical protein